jgi:hypothetical protein
MQNPCETLYYTHTVAYAIWLMLSQPAIAEAET